MKKRCWVCGKKIWFGNRRLCFNVTNVTGGTDQNIKRGTKIHVCNKCVPLLWRGIDVSFPTDIIKAKIDAINFDEEKDERKA